MTLCLMIKSSCRIPIKDLLYSDQTSKGNFPHSPLLKKKFAPFFEHHKQTALSEVLWAPEIFAELHEPASTMHP